jgi:hypothetical protein
MNCFGYVFEISAGHLRWKRELGSRNENTLMEEGGGICIYGEL